VPAVSLARTNRIPPLHATRRVGERHRPIGPSFEVVRPPVSLWRRWAGASRRPAAEASGWSCTAAAPRASRQVCRCSTGFSSASPRARASTCTFACSTAPTPSTCSRRSSRRSASRSRRRASRGADDQMTEKSVVRTEAAPAPFQGAPYSQAIRAGGLVFVSGQLGLKPGDERIEGGIVEQTEQIFRNLRAVLEEAGSGLDRLVKTTVFLIDLDDFGP